MTADQALAVLDVLASAGVEAWVDGGWGIDALVGAQTRAHGDLDLVVAADALDVAVAALAGEGFGVLRVELPASIALRHADGREVDLHPVEPTADGGGDQTQPDGVERWHYGPPTLGRIAGRDVLCCSLETQLRSHVGYEPDEDDVADMRVLAAHFGCALPPPYDRA